MTERPSLDTLCAALCKITGVAPPPQAAEADSRLLNYADTAFDGETADRLFMYNPDAIAEWLFEKYPAFFIEATARTELQLPYETVMPSVTPVCFGTMYTGVQPAVHGIRKYEKPVLKIETLFDQLIRAGKKIAIVADNTCSIGKIFLEREMDYFIYESEPAVNAKAAELILRDEHDAIIVYNGNYDSRMHKTGPESAEALGELRTNAKAFGMFYEMIAEHWAGQNTLMGFAMDHGCHEIDGECGCHGLDMDEDLNITHFYKVLPKK
jgi:predicted AlkP superfamily pyrophosphatase or phosphodiesterase